MLIHGDCGVENPNSRSTIDNVYLLLACILKLWQEILYFTLASVEMTAFPEYRENGTQENAASKKKSLGNYR